MSKPKTVTVWITRDEEGENDCDKLWIHAKKPELDDGEWGSGSEASVVPSLKYGKCKRIRLSIEE